MGYAQENEQLSPSIDKILEGMEEFNNAVNDRIKSGEWNSAHIQRLNELRKEFNDLQIEIYKLK